MSKGRNLGGTECPQSISQIAKALVADDRGLLAMDESTPTCDKRFAN